jgi:hypothetical protein
MIVEVSAIAVALLSTGFLGVLGFRLTRKLINDKAPPNR